MHPVTTIGQLVLSYLTPWLRTRPTIRKLMVSPVVVFCQGIGIRGGQRVLDTRGGCTLRTTTNTGHYKYAQG